MHLAPPLRPLSETHSRGLADRWDRNYVHSVDWRWLTHRGDSGPGESWLKPTVDLVKGENMTPLERFRRRCQRHRPADRHQEMDVHEHRPGRPCAPAPRGRVDRYSGERPTTGRTASAPRSAH